MTATWGGLFEAIRTRLRDLDNLILLGILMTLFFMPLHEKLKAAGFLITLAFWLTQLIKERHQQKIWIPPLAWALLLFVGMAFLSAAFSDYPNRAARGALDAFRNTAFFLILIHTINSQQKMKYLMFALMGGILLGDLAAIYKYFSIGSEIEMLSLGEKNSTAQVLSMFLALTLGLLFSLHKEYLFRIVLLSMTILTGFVLVLTYARGIWLAVLSMLIIFGLIRFNWKIPVAFAILIGAVWVGMSYSDRFSQKVTSFKNPLTEANMVGRYEIWRQSLEMVRDRPLLGLGLKTYGLPQVTQKYHLASSSHAHNMFLNVAVELGLAGLIALTLWLIFYLYTIIMMRSSLNSKFKQGLWLSGLGCFVLLMVGGITHPMLGSESSLMLMTVLGLVFAGFRTENKASVWIAASLYKLPGGHQWEHQSKIAFRSMRGLLVMINY